VGIGTATASAGAGWRRSRARSSAGEGAAWVAAARGPQAIRMRIVIRLTKTTEILRAFMLILHGMMGAHPHAADGLVVR
jgi:hypothetical protein